MSSASPETPDRQPQSVSRTQEVTVRRAPNLLAFVATGAAVGALVPGSIAYTRAAIIGFFLMMFLILGATLGAVVGLLLDRVSLKRSRNASAEVEDVHEGGHRTHS